jgi:hypothetical protein
MRTPARKGARRKKRREATRAEIHAAFRDVVNLKQRAFLVGYVKSKRTRIAAMLAGVSREAHYYWLRHDDDYLENWKKARQMLGDMVEEEVYRRAVEGYAAPVIFRGEITDRYKAFSDRLAMFLLRGLKPEIYGPKAGEDDGMSGPTGIDIRILGPGETLADAEAADAALAALPDPEDPEKKK